MPDLWKENQVLLSALSFGFFGFDPFSGAFHVELSNENQKKRLYKGQSKTNHSRDKKNSLGDYLGGVCRPFQRFEPCQLGSS